MEAMILDQTTYVAKALIDQYISFIWAERYYQCSDFELLLATPITDELKQAVNLGNYIYLNGSDELMIIETIECTSNVEEGHHMKIEGRSLTAILERRIIWDKTIVSGNLNTVIKKLITENIISPTMSDRRIANFVYEDCTDPRVTGKNITKMEYQGDNLLEVITNLCQTNDVGFKVTYNDENHTFVFKLYAGTDRSYNQVQNPYVAFRSEFDNIMSSTFLTSIKTLKSVVRVSTGLADDEGTVGATVGSNTEYGGMIGLRRWEAFVNYQPSREKEDGTVMQDREYKNTLSEYGLKIIKENMLIKSFDGEIDTTQNYQLGRDFLIGDIVQLSDEFGNDGMVRITEIIQSQDDTGIHISPGFTKYPK